MSCVPSCPNCESDEVEEISPIPGFSWFECLHCGEQFTEHEVYRTHKKKKVLTRMV